ncbi:MULTISPECIES: DMT family transporter [unclassified Adlercreutzia]|uniref:DMT family transporter n=1 Tax=unclassified Adlercreutzia TaxID=2636013 RepID=UPI00197E5F4A|nr:MULTISPECIES: DMT family transporter [unclassified Adlercreutzia]
MGGDGGKSDGGKGNDGFQMDKRRGVIALLVATTGMGLSGLLNRGSTRVDFFGGELVAGESIGAFMTVGRMGMGLVLFAILLVLTHKTALFRRTRISPAIVLGGLSVGVSFAFYLVSALLTSLANAVFLIYTGPLFCTLLARAFRKEPISRFQGLCLGAVFAGMLLTSGVVSVGSGGVSVGFSLGASTPEFPQKGLGDALGLLSGVFYGLSLFFNGYRKDCDSTVRGVWNFLFATVGSLAVACAMCAAWPLGEVAMTPANWGFALALWIICGPVGLGFLLVAGRNLPAVEYSTISYWECVVSLLTSVLVFHEAMTAGTVIGGALIMLGGALPAFQALRGSAARP